MSSNNDSIATTKNIGKATAWSLAAEVAAKLIVPITNMVLARILTPSAFGIIATLNVVISFAETFSTAGFQKYIIQHTFDDEQSLHNSATVAFWTNVVISAFTWGVIAAFRNPLAKAVGSAGYGIPLAIAALSLPLNALSTVYEAMFQRRLEYRVLFVRRIVVSLLPFVVTIPLALLGLGHWALIIGTLAGSLVKAVLMAIVTKWKPRFYFNFSLLREMVSFGLWTLLESIAMWACSYIDILIISNKLGEYYTGLYKNSQQTVTGILSIITGATTSVAFAALSREQNNKTQFEGVFYTFQRNIAVFVIPLGFGILCFKDLVTWVLLGDNWMEASDFVGIWGFCTACVCAWGTLVREAYRAKGKPRLSAFAQFLHLLFIVPVCYYCVRLGFERFIYIRSVIFLQMIVVHMVFVKVFLKMSPFKMLWDVKECVCSALVMFAMGTWLLSVSDSLWVQFVWILVCILLYFGVLFLFPKYRKDIRRVISGFSDKVRGIK